MEFEINWIIRCLPDIRDEIIIEKKLNMKKICTKN